MADDRRTQLPKGPLRVSKRLPEAFSVEPSDSFAILLVENIGQLVDLDAPFRIGDDIWFHPGSPLEIDEVWLQAIGTLRARELKDSKFCLATRQQVLDPGAGVGAEASLRKRLGGFYFCLQLLGIPAQGRHSVVSGTRTTDRHMITGWSDGLYRFMEETDDWVVTRDSLSRADALARAYGSVFVKGRWLRLQRGFHALCEALTVEGEESALHHFVQAIEALIKPGQYSNERLFWQRCRAFIDNAEDYERTLKDVYWIRCNIEHMHGPVAAYKDKRPAIDEDAFKLRLWQTQNLALAAYRGLLSSPELLEAFTDDDSIDRFWADEAAVARGWPNRLPLSRIGWREVVEGVKVLGVEGWEPISIHGPAKSLPW